MDATEIWDKLESDNKEDIYWIIESQGLSGFETFRKSVMEKIDPSEPYEDALNIFRQEFDNI